MSGPDRRTILKGAAAAALLPTTARAQRTEQSTRRTIWAAAMMTRPLAERIEAVAASDFTAMSVFPADMKRWNEEGLSNAEIGRMVRAGGIDVIALDPFTGWVPGWSMEGLDQATRNFIDFSEDEIWAWADALDAEKINAVQSVGDDYELSAYSDALGAFAERAKSHGRGVALEFMPISKIPDLATGWELIRTAGDDIGMIFDTWHFWRSNPDHDLLATIPGERIYEVQIADAKDEIVENLMVDLLSHRRIPGEGDFDLVRTLAVLREIGGLRSYGPETFSDDMNALTASEAVRANAKGFATVMAQVPP